MMLYIHIPFCRRKCGYCDFLSFAGCESKFSPYVEALCKELIIRRPRIGTPITSVYIGGGTPNILPIPLIEKIFNCILDNYTLSSDCEITMELNPGIGNNALLRSFPLLPINRVSIGLQSSDNEELKMLGRIHTFSDFLKTYEAVAKSDISNINVDVMTGIPKQSLPSLEKTLRIVTGLRPAHISTYALILEEKTAFYRKYKKGFRPLPDDETEYRLYKLAIDYLTSHGYERYEISNFSKEGLSSRHNMGYWNRNEYIGCGLGAASFINHTRYKNIDNLNTYLEIFKDIETFDSDKLFESVSELSKKDEIEEFMYLGLRKIKGVSLSDFEKAFGESLDTYYHSLIEYLCNEGFMERSYGQVWLTDLGIDVSNQVLSKFLLG